MTAYNPPASSWVPVNVRNEIDSTEKLLTVIRGEEKRERKLSADSAPAPSPDKGGRIVRLFGAKSVTVGVEAGKDSLRLVKLRQHARDSWEVLAFQNVPIAGAAASGDNASTRAKLRQALTTLCGSDRKVQVWAQMDTADCEIRSLQIPKVPRRNLTQTVYWSLRKVVTYDESETIFDYEVLGTRSEGNINKLDVLAYTVPRASVSSIKTLFARSGYPLAGLTLAPFAFWNIFRALPDEDSRGLVGVLYVGDDGSRIDILEDGKLVFTRLVRTGMSSLYMALMEGRDPGETDAVENGQDVVPEAPVDMSDEEALRFGKEQGSKLLSVLGSRDEFPPEEDPRNSGLDPGRILELITPPVERLMRQVDLSFSHHSQHTGSRRVSRVYVAGQISSYRPLLDFIQNQLGITTRPLDAESLDGVLKWRQALPRDPDEIGRLLPVVAVAMRARETPNLLETHIEREKAARIKVINGSIFTLFMLLILSGLGLFFWQEHRLSAKKEEVARLEQVRKQFTRPVSREMIREKLDTLHHERLKLGAFIERYRLLAVQHEIAARTPEHVRLVRMDYVDPGRQGNNRSPCVLVLDGLVTGRERNLDIRLNAYLASLEASSLLGASVLERRTRLYKRDNTEVLKFTVRINIDEI